MPIVSFYAYGSHSFSSGDKVFVCFGFMYLLVFILKEVERRNKID